MTPLAMSSASGMMTDAVWLWLVNAVLYGSVVAVMTYLLIKTVFRKSRPGVHALLWMLVLIKFLIPVGPGASFSLASVVSAVTGWQPAPVAPAPLPPTATPASGDDVTFLFVASPPVCGIAPQPSAAATAAGGETLRWVIGGYLAILAALLAVRVSGYVRFARRCRAFPVADAEIGAQVAEICGRLGVRRVPEVRVSETAPAPFVFGVVRPVLVLSRRQFDSAAELEAVTLHEIAHLRRGDLLVRHLQWLAGTLLFFWPIVAWVNRRIDLLREYACDEWALRHGQLSAGDYARCLLRAVQPHRPRWTQFRPAAMAANRGTVERRIDMILSSQTVASRRWWWLPIGSAVVAWGVFVLAGTSPASGAASDKKAPVGASECGTWVTDDNHTVIVVKKVVAVGDEGDEQVNVEVLTEEDLEGLPQWNFKIPGLADGEAPAVFIARSAEGPGEWQNGVASMVIRGPGEEELAEFLADHPTADANSDGTLNRTEHDAYLAAVAMTDPAAVIRQYPRADRNSDGAIDADEAARLVTGGPSIEGLPGCAKMLGGEAGAHIRMFAHAEDDGAGDAVPRIIKMRTSVEGADGQVPAIVEAPAQAHKVIVRRVQKDDGTMEVTVDSSCDGAADVDVSATHDVLMGLPGLKDFVPATAWIKQNLDASVTAAQVALCVPAVEQAPLATFLEMNPDADDNGDGRLTPAERDAYMERHMSKARGRLLERFPDADANADGLLTNDELHEYFKSKHGGGGAPRIEIRKNGGAMGPTAPVEMTGPPVPTDDGC